MIAQVTTPRLGVCYYPEQWPREWWADDARRMREMGLSQVRIGEFAWSRIEPERGRFDWAWLDEAIEVLAEAGLAVVMCTPTATPPKWLIDRMPDIIAIDVMGRPRRFGSRRHYCFSHEGYRAESRRITRAVAERYGAHPAVIAWQTDNEYGCHDTTLSWSVAALKSFRSWLVNRYKDIGALNAAWGNAFWSMEYGSFEEIDLPNLTVTEPNPAHVLEFRRFSSHQVVTFNEAQCRILREYSPGRTLTHNFMGFVTDFDHHEVSRDLDVVSWDSYPLGFLEQFWFTTDQKLRYARQGHPDIAAFHHDLYRGVGRGRWWVMEQQSGPVNWARFNPSPLPGMIRLWTLEAIAHGAEVVSYFRWRQTPFAQEQMHAGLLRPDRKDDVAADEVRRVVADLQSLPDECVDTQRSTVKAEVALVFDCDAEWITQIQPQGAGESTLRTAFEWYSALRSLGLDVDVLPSSADLSLYKVVVIPCSPIVSESFAAQLRAISAHVLIGPRSGSKTSHFAIPWELPPGNLQSLIPIKVIRVESLREGMIEPGRHFNVHRWLEHVETSLVPEWVLMSGRGVLYRHQNVRYLAAALDDTSIRQLMKTLTQEAGLHLCDLSEGLRLRRLGDLRFAFNYSTHTLSINDVLPSNARVLRGAVTLAPAEVAIWIE